MPLTMPRELKDFQSLVQAGVRPPDAYRRVYAIGRTISRQAAEKGASRHMDQLAGLIPPRNRVKPTATVNPPKQPDMQPSAPTKTSNIKGLPRNREELERRLWETVLLGTNPEATSAAKQLRDWMDAEAARNPIIRTALG